MELSVLAGRWKVRSSILVLVFSALALVYPIWKIFFDQHPEVDFRVFWFAGWMWNHGLDPYTSDFFELGNASLPDGNRLYHWLYPPNWALICSALAITDLQTSLTVWRLVATLFYIFGAVALIMTLTREFTASFRLMLASFGCAAVMWSDPVAVILSAGQVSPPFVYLGLALIVCGYVDRKHWLLTAGLVFVALKPQIGASLYIAFALVPELRRSVVAAVLISVLLALPQFLAHGPITSVLEWLGNLRVFNEVNSPLTLSGPGHLLARLNLPFPQFIQHLMVIVVGGIAGLLMRRDKGLAALAFLFSGICALVPLHNYDFAMLLPATVLAVCFLPARYGLALIVAMLIFTLRPSSIESLSGMPVILGQSGGVMLMSVAALLLFAVSIALLQNNQRPFVPNPD